MHSRRVIWIVLCLLCVAGAWLFWRAAGRRAAEKDVAATALVATGSLTGAAPLTNPALVSAAAAKTNRLAYRLSNTTRTIGELTGDRRAILLENALIDSSLPLNFTFPKNLLAQGDPGAYIVQSRGPVSAAFRALLAGAGAEIISYIPNDAYLVRLTAGGAGGLAAQPRVQSVIPYEPYYKLQLALLGAAVKQSPLPAGAVLNLGLFAGDAPQTISAIEKLGGTILSRDSSPFGPVVRVKPPSDWTALAALPGVQIVEAWHPRVPANDLSRVTVGVATNTLVSSNYMNLTGKNVMVAVNDSGIDATHPDFTTGGSANGGPGGAPVRVFALSTNDLVDTDGHGTHVAGIIAGNGSMSLNPVNVGSVAEGSVSNADFRGKAPQATLFSMNMGNSDQALQEQAALTNALISNNSWGYGNNTYDLAAASYDAATRDSLPEVTGSQPVLFVFAAGNDGYIGQNGGGGDNNGGSVTPDTITSPGTAKNVITVGALEQMRNITNSVTNLDGSVSEPWQPETDTGYQVAFYSSRGNVGVGIEGANGRLKPDVAAPGSFVVSTRSAQWATNAYYNPTNYDDNTYTGQSVGVNGINYYSLFVPQNAVSVTVQIQQNNSSPNPFPTNLPIYVSQYDYPDPTDPTTYDFYEMNEVLIPPDPDGTGAYLTQIQGTGFNYAVVNTNSQTVNYNLFTEVATTNDLGNYYQVLEGMNDSLGGYYRYESGTSMAAADVSGTLALIQDFFTNTLQMTPSPALLKAMLINGARPTLPYYNMQAGNPINNEGWGLINLPNSLPTNAAATFIASGSTPASMFIQDQSPTNALATGDSHSFTLTISSNAPAAPLRLTLTWTDPPGDPVAAIKLVNGLELVVTNLDNPTNPVVYYGNDILANGFNTAENATNIVSVDAINNVQNVFIPQPVGTNYTVTVIGREVNVNAVSAQTNLFAGPPNGAGVYAPNVVQDYALVISCGDAFTVTDNGIVSNPTGDQNISIIATTNTANPLSDQFVGANSPVLNTNTVSFTSNTAFGGNAVDTLGMSNQWHFYVVTNNGAADYTNAAFVIYSSVTLSVPRMGVFADSVTNATMPQANIDLYATTDPTLTTLNPAAISNCVNGVVNGPSASSLGRGGNKFIVFSNSAPGDVYYIGVKSEDQMASEYSFLSVFSNVPFDQNNNGDAILTGVSIPATIPAGNPSVPGFVDVVAFAVQPIQAAWVIVTNVIQQTDVGDLVSSLTFNNTTAVLMNHDSPNTPGNFYYVYDDSGTVDPATLPAGYTLQHSDGPGSLQDFVGQNVSSGVWVFHLANSVEPFTGNVINFNLRIHPQLPLTSGVTNTIPGHGVFRDFVDVPAGATNLTINATNITSSPDTVNPLLMTIKFGSEPTLLNADKGPVPLINGTAVGSGGAGLGNSLSVGPTDVPPIQPGRYYVDITNQSATAQTVFVIAVILPPNPTGTLTTPPPAGPTQILDDAVTYSDIFVTNTMPIVSVNAGIEVQDPRISDLVFHLISPDGTRVLLMENRGGQNTNGAGVTVMITNVTVAGSVVTTNSLAGAAAGDYAKGQTVAGWTVNTNQVSLVNDPLNAYQGNNLLALANGSLSTTIATVPGQTYSVTLPYRGPGIAGWWRAESNALDSINGNNGIIPTTTNSTIVWTNGFEGRFAADYVTNQVVAGWTVNSNQVSLVTDANNAWRGSNFLALANGVISTNLSTIAGQTYTLSFAYRGPGIAAMWRGESNANDSIGTNNGTLMGGAGFAAGEVGQAFLFNGTNDVSIPDSPLLDSFTNRITIEAWVKVNSFAGAGWDCILAKGNLSWELRRYGSGSTAAFTTIGLSNQNLGGTKNINDGQWHHVAGVYDGINKYLYVDGVLDASVPAAGTIQKDSYPLYIGGNAQTQGKLPGYFWNGLVDEASLYSRALSPSEIKAIYQKGGAGKFDSSSSFSTNLAEIKVSLTGQTPVTIYGSNTVWQTYSNTFTATTNQTLLSIAGLQPGVLLDGFVLTGNVVNSLVTYTNGEVGQAFQILGPVGPQQSPPFTGPYVQVPNSSYWNFGAGDFTIDLWANFATAPNGDAGHPSGGMLMGWDNASGNHNKWLFMTGGGVLEFHVNGPTINGGAGVFLAQTPFTPALNQWYHLAVNRKGSLYTTFVNGVAGSSSTDFNTIPNAGVPLTIGQAEGFYINGSLDEVSIYQRALSASEIKAIYTAKTNGKYDPIVFNTSPAKSLAEAQLNVTGQSAAALYGSNTTWQTYTATFKAVTNQTTLTLAGVEPGVLLGPLLMTSPVLVTTVATNIYYLAFTENTNLTTTPIKFAPPPFVPPITTPTNVFTDSFETYADGLYSAGAKFGGWTVLTNQIAITNSPAAFDGTNLLSLISGAVSNTVPTLSGQTYNLSFEIETNSPVYFYGTTSLGGSSGDGTVFKVTPNGTLTTLVSFNGANGNSPWAGLTLGNDGNFYGTTSGIGLGTPGTIFKVTPNGTLTTLHTFTGGADGSTPIGALTLGNDGNFYGTTDSGGSSNDGVVFKMTTSGTLTILTNFNGANGAYPHDALTLGNDGNFYGTTYGNGTPGTIFKVTTNGTLTSLYSFTGGADGSAPIGALTLGSDGNFYGTTDLGGSGGDGVVFKVTTNGTMSTLVSFNGANGNGPWAGLTPGNDGNFYGTAAEGGSNNYGVVFKMTPGGTMTTLVNFNGVNGEYPLGALTLGADGNFYGMTQLGGTGGGDGTVFKVTTNGMLTTLVNFNGTDGQAPRVAGLTLMGGGTWQPVWQPASNTFTASQNGTPLVLDASGGGYAVNSVVTGAFPTYTSFDDFVLTAVPGNLYYQPEQSLGAFTGKSAYGDWQLEIQDDRAGAGRTNLLVSWELQFVFANTNAIPAVLSGGIGQSNQFIPAGNIAWYQINVPANANFATNILKFASARVNVWFSTNVPPTITNPGDVDLIPNSKVDSVLLGTNGSPVNTTTAYIVPGGTYYLGAQNTNISTVNYGIEVDFDHGNAPGSGLPALVINGIKASGSGTTMNWTASASAQFQMQWTDDLTQPWNTDTNVITSGDGNFNFTDDGLQTAPLGTQRYYRLVQISP